MKIRPFSGYMVNADFVDQVVAPAYDALTAAERHAFALDHPLNYINTMRTPDQYPQTDRPGYDEVLKQNRERLTSLLNSDAFAPLQNQSMFLYRLSIDDHEQTGLVCSVPVSEYEAGIVRKHENTRSDKEDMLARYLHTVAAVSSPICLTYDQQPDIDQLVEQLITADAVLDFVAEDGVRQTIWLLDDNADQQKFTDLFAQVSITYLTDGHHRAASGARYAAQVQQAQPQSGDDDPKSQLLAILFPHNQLRVLPYNRCIEDLQSLESSDFLQALEQDFEVTPLSKNAQTSCLPGAAGQFGMLLDDNWFLLKIKDNLLLQKSITQSLDVSLLQDHILGPLLGIVDVRNDPRLEYVAGVNGVSGVEKQCCQGWRLGFACHPTSIREMMEVSDEHGLMPPKSTWFDPKVRSGIFVSLR